MTNDQEQTMTTMLNQAPDGTPCRPMVSEPRRGGFHDLTCLDCGHAVTFVNATAQRVQWFTTSHRCGGPTWQG